MRVLVVGGTEFVSLHLVRALRRQRHEVACLNRGRRGPQAPDVATIIVDRRDHAALARALDGERFDAVFDVAYAPTTGDDVSALLDAVSLGRPGHVIFVSSARVYDHTRPIPFDEETPRNLYWGDYANNKIAGEDVLIDRHRRAGLPITIVRPTHVMGPLNTRNNETFFFDRLLRGRPVVIPGHGGWLRQFGHVEDLAEAMTAMAGDGRAVGQAYNVTGEEVITQAGLVELIAEVVGRPLTLVPVDPSRLAPGPSGLVFGQNLVYECHAVHTTTKLRRELGLRPRYTLTSALTQTYEWYRKEGLDRRDVDFTTDDALLKLAGA
jgi:nucleoside-diphosphate-sugar epimerase